MVIVEPTNPNGRDFDIASYFLEVGCRLIKVVNETELGYLEWKERLPNVEGVGYIFTPA